MYSIFLSSDIRMFPIYRPGRHPDICGHIIAGFRTSSCIIYAMISGNRVGRPRSATLCFYPTGCNNSRSSDMETFCYYGYTLQSVLGINQENIRPEFWKISFNRTLTMRRSETSLIGNREKIGNITLSVMIYRSSMVPFVCQLEERTLSQLLCDMDYHCLLEMELANDVKVLPRHLLEPSY